MNNTRLICSHIIDEKKRETQKDIDNKLKEMQAKGGKTYAKRTFKDTSGKSEHMWIHINSIDYDSKTINGVLDNDPCILKNIKCGDIVSCHFDEIIELLNF